MRYLFKSICEWPPFNSKYIKLHIMSKICGEMWTECIDVIKRKPIKTEYVLMSGVAYEFKMYEFNLQVNHKKAE